MRRMRERVLLPLVVCATAWFAAQSSTPRAQRETPAQKADFFPLAVWYGGGKARAPMLERVDATSSERWGKDLDQIRALGFNSVKCWVDWATGEPKPDVFRFEALDLLLRLAEARGLRVIVQVYLDAAPDWVGERYPEAQFVERGGTVIKSQAAPGFCLDHPGVQEEVVKFLQALSRQANRSSALCGWDVWSEPHVINWAEFPYLPEAEFCFCPSSQARFRQWLKRKYGTIETLNVAWYRGFERWEQVEPPRASTILSYTDYLDWRAFIDDKLAGDLKARVKAIRTADTAHPITSHAAVPGLFTSPTSGYGDPDDWKMAASADFFGTSIYPKHAASLQPWPYTQIAAGLDFTRSAGGSFEKGFWIGELQAGQGVTGMRIADPVDARDLEFWMWKVVSHGARSLALYAWYPMSSGYESNGYGLIDLDGTLTERARAAGRVAQLIHRHAAELLACRPAPAEVAILFNRLSYMVGGAQPSLSTLGNATRDSLMGLHRAFLEEQIPVDFVHLDDLVQDKLGQYKILFLPFPVMLTGEAAAALKRYVAAGGTAVAEARLAWNDERGFSTAVIPGFGLSEVFGAREDVIRPADKPQLWIEPAAGLPDLEPGATIVGEAFEEELEALGGGQVLGRFANRAPAMVARTYGQGRAVLIGSFLALAYQRQHQTSTKRLLLALAKVAGVRSEVKVGGVNTTDVEVRRLVNEDAQFLFVFNHSEAPASVKVMVRLPWLVREVRTLADEASVRFSQAGNVLTLRQSLVPGQSWVVRLRR